MMGSSSTTSIRLPASSLDCMDPDPDFGLGGGCRRGKNDVYDAYEQPQENPAAATSTQGIRFRPRVRCVSIDA
jgi:hypothetical protein